jgi:hypothetical protein
MSVFNRRNALIGYVTIVGAKQLLRQKARAAVPSVDSKTHRPNKSAIALAVTGLLIGAATVLHHRSNGNGPAAPAE